MNDFQMYELGRKEDRLKYLFETYGKRIPFCIAKERLRKKLPINETLNKHKEAIWLIDEIYKFQQSEMMTRSRAKELIANVIQEHIKKL